MPPLHDTRATGDVILDLAKRLGGDISPRIGWSSVEQIVRERAVSLAGLHRGSAFVEAFRQDELRELEGRGWWLPHGESPEQYAETILATGGWFDPIHDYHDRSAVSQHADGRVWIFPDEARRWLQGSGEPLTEGFLPITSEATAPPNKQAYPLRLIPYRVLTLASGGTALMPWLLEHLGLLTGHAWEAWAEVNPETARELGLHAGQRVRVESEAGGFETTIRIFSGAQPGVVNVPYGLHTYAHGWGEARGGNPLAALRRPVQPVSGLPDWYSTNVRLTAI
jgi:anaerobic selenocysteine-containing dehydrogenase